jgi:hypothetical protein
VEAGLGLTAQNIFPAIDAVEPFIASNTYTVQNISFRRDDIVMKMQVLERPFVDGPYAKFYALSSELLRVGPKCNSNSVTPDSFHPAEAVAGRERAVGISAEMLIVPAPRAAETEGVLGSRSPHTHGRKP